ncbi:DUF1906 domain-containing protein [Bradyrhizobium diazoefficiens]|uniref:glycoside hydrolase domain-containing protein n=1 Tax=Bradyrhizobium diazoefficiens TaxID=1355477 RepID=UPI001B8C3EDC|nr:glycoside hydrolase domain-containing protein [Bradyrhizobium diazoefficiens]MBR0868444.1 DUF1906 domain-containing protein [Bradyrhizobium diazoefficiens]MBR0892998.1 DUF1906 domain-containing protein [Bradyrhizobium diazoefficiens]MBR0924696.1 DUF1906 domain-containing protein [Bradyrhizobium diazoefficiens]
MLVIDTNTSYRGFGPWLKSQGVTAVGRYYGATTNSKDLLDAQEAIELCRNGMQIFVVFEDASRPNLNLTADQGTADAKIALKMAGDIGQPPGSAIYFSVEGDYGQGDVSDIENYWSGITAKIAGRYALAVYGSGFVCSTLLSKHACKYTWVAAASTGWNGTCNYFGGKTPMWHLAQVPPLDMNWTDQATGKTLSVDIDLTDPPRHNGDFGGFVVPLPVF